MKNAGTLSPCYTLLFLWMGLCCLPACSDYRHPNLQPRPIGWQPDRDLNPYKDYSSKIASLEDLPNTRMKLDSLLEWADLMNYEDKEATLAYANRAYTLAAENGFRFSRAIASYYRGLMKRRGSSFGEGLYEAIADLEISQNLLEEADPVIWQLQIKGLLGSLYFSKAYDEDRLELLDSTQLYLQQCKELIESPTLSTGLAAYYRAQNFKDQAYYYETKRDIKDVILPDSIFNRDSIAFYNQRVLRYLSMGIEEAKLAQNKALEARIWRGMGDFFVVEEAYPQADSAYTVCEELVLATGDTSYLVDVFQKIADLKGRQFFETSRISDFEESMAYLQRCLRIQKENLFYTYNLIAWNYDDYLYLSGDPPQRYSSEGDSALVYYNLALEGARKEGAISSMENIVKNMNALCGHRLRLTGEDCSAVIGAGDYHDLLNESYADLVEKMQLEIQKSNEQLRGFERDQLIAFNNRQTSRIWIRNGIILLLITLVFLLFLLFTQRKRFQARMEALRAQINPHFMHNSLNAIESLVNQNERAAASKYLVHFSRLSRKVLNSSRDVHTNLKEEFQTLKHFLELEKLRFRDKLTYELKMAPNLEAEQVKIPALLLQPYVENAILHGIKPKETGGHLQVFAERQGKKLVCTIEDNGIGRARSEELKRQSVFQQKRKSHGMKINEERIRLASRFAKTRVEIQDLFHESGEPAGTRVLIRLPYQLIKPKAASSFKL